MDNIHIVQDPINTYYGYRTLYECFSGDISVMPALQMHVWNENHSEKQKTRINIGEEQDIICRLRLTPTLLNDFNNILYYSSESEQNAQINATIPFLKNKNIARDKKTVNNIISLIDQSEDLNCFYKYQFYFERFYNWWTCTNDAMINNIYVFGYFYKKYSGDKNARKIKISKHDILNIKNIEYDEKHKQCWIIVGIISDNFEAYKKRLYDTVITHCLIN